MVGQVVLVSGDDVFASKSKELLAAQNLELQVIQPGQSVPSLLTEKRPDVVVVDIGGNGANTELDIIQALRCREHLRRIPVIAVLQHASPDLVMSVREAGVLDILAKGGDEATLIQRIVQHCHAAAPRPTAGNAQSSEDDAASREWSDPATTAFKKKVQREVSRRLETLPSLPTVVMEILQLVESDKSCASDFEEHISHDPALASRVLRIVNSSFFSLSRTIKSIRDAIVILGFETLKSLVMAASTSNFLNKPAIGYGYQVGGLWKHSIACAHGSRLLAKRLGYQQQEAEVFFVQGLLHDIGKLLLNNFVVDKVSEFRKAMEQRGLSLLDCETLIMGTDHCTVGARIAERWNLPREFACVIEHHHHPRRASTALRKQTILVHIVNHWCHELAIGMLPETHVKDILDSRAVKEIGLNEDDLRDYLETFSAQLKDVEELFSMIGRE